MLLCPVFTCFCFVIMLLCHIFTGCSVGYYVTTVCPVFIGCSTGYYVTMSCIYRLFHWLQCYYVLYIYRLLQLITMLLCPVFVGCSTGYYATMLLCPVLIGCSTGYYVLYL